MAIRLLKILAPVTVPLIMFGQSFSVTAKDTLLPFSPGQELLYTVTIVNNKTSPLTLAVKRTEEAMPEGSNTSMCFNICFEPSVDSIATTRTFGSTPLDPSEVRDFSLHLYCGTVSGSILVRLTFIDLDSTVDRKTLSFRTIPTSVGNGDVPTIPSGVQILNAYPNPFNPSTTIGYSVPRDGSVSLKIYDAVGREVATLVESEVQGCILQKAVFDATGLSSGVYFSRLVFDEQVSMKKIIFMR
jgi:hypothetical protein